jgi:hypothetical protein
MYFLEMCPLQQPERAFLSEMETGQPPESWLYLACVAYPMFEAKGRVLWMRIGIQLAAQLLTILTSTVDIRPKITAIANLFHADFFHSFLIFSASVVSSVSVKGIGGGGGSYRSMRDRGQ